MSLVSRQVSRLFFALVGAWGAVPVASAQVPIDGTKPTVSGIYGPIFAGERRIFTVAPGVRFALTDVWATLTYQASLEYKIEHADLTTQVFWDGSTSGPTTHKGNFQLQDGFVFEGGESFVLNHASGGRWTWSGHVVYEPPAPVTPPPDTLCVKVCEPPAPPDTLCVRICDPEDGDD